MAKDREEQEIKVTDRRRFSAEGDVLREGEDRPAEAAPPPPPAPEAAVTPPPPAASAPPQPEAPPRDDVPVPPSAADQQASRDAFSAAGVKLDHALDEALGAQHRPDVMKACFETFIAELYMSAMFQLGMLHEKGQQPQVDLVGARHTIDTISMLEEKTRGNLDPNEKAVVQDCLFRLRMAFVEITNVLTRPPEPGAKGPGGK